ncbi:RHS repeat-associated core domain-containing protein [Stenotrophomonas terrae]|uniref:RHS repeat-associated core domain-containing protein n=1 Tax=Stenotrophomonas terrae TaxID=405446 RepID=UPI003209740A
MCRQRGEVDFFTICEEKARHWRAFCLLWLSELAALLSGSLIARREAVGNVVAFQHADALGSPVAVTDGSGNVIERNDYAPYGAVIGKPAYDAVGYTGHKQDGATGLTYMQQRYYDPQIGRFLSVDPVTAYSNPVGAFNRYWYGNNNPYRFTDPDGRYSCT